MTQVFPLTSWYVYGADKICAIVFLISLMASKQEGLIAFGPDIIDMMLSASKPLKQIQLAGMHKTFPCLYFEY